MAGPAPKHLPRFHTISILGKGVMIVSPDDRGTLKSADTPCPACAESGTKTDDVSAVPVRCSCCNTLFVFVPVAVPKPDGRRGFRRRA